MCVGGLIVELDGPLGRVNGFVHRFSRGLLVLAHVIHIQEILVHSRQLKIDAQIVGVLSDHLFELRLQGLQLFLIVGFPRSFNGGAERIIRCRNRSRRSWSYEEQSDVRDTKKAKINTLP